MVESLRCGSNNLLTCPGKDESNILQTPSDSVTEHLYEETYGTTGEQSDLVVYSDEQCVEGFKGEGDRVIIEHNEGVVDGDYRMFHIFEETVVESEMAE